MPNTNAMPPCVTLNSGNKIPVVAFGTAAPFLGKDCSEAILQALHAGIRHFDTAQLYENQYSIGRALEQWEGKREEIYITSKWGLEGDARNDPRAALEETLKLMNIEYVDMFMMHSPITIHPNTINESWAIMETLQIEGKCKDIGISNFGSLDIKQLSETWKVVPAINQIEFSPYNAHDPRSKAVLEICKDNGIMISAFGCIQPLLLKDDPRPLDSILDRIADKEDMTEGQVLLKWAQQMLDGPVITTSEKQTRMMEYVHAFEKHPLTDEDMDKIMEAGKGRYYRRYLDPFRP